jgi:hypothetical protein
MALTDLQRALAYGESELGEVAILKLSDGTYTINRARRRQRAYGWSGGGNHQGARRCGSSSYVEDST